MRPLYGDFDSRTAPQEYSVYSLTYWPSKPVVESDFSSQDLLLFLFDIRFLMRVRNTKDCDRRHHRPRQASSC